MPKPVAKKNASATEVASGEVAEANASKGAKTKPTAGKPKKPPKAEAPATRPIKYPERVVHLAVGDDAVDIEQAKNLLGWEEETEAIKFDADYLLTDIHGKKIRCTNNTRNRPLSESWCLTLAQEHLRRRWRFNFETIVIGKTGEVHSGQHRLISVILAEQLRLKDLEEDGYWATNWPGPVTMETLIGFGADEDDDVVNTLDTGRARSVSDVLYRSELLRKYPSKTRKVMSVILFNAARVLWSRTRLSNDPYSPDRTHSEVIDLLSSHSTILDVAKHIIDAEASNRAVSKWLSMGPMTALTYLMATSKSNPENWDRTEKTLDLSLLSKSEEFIDCLAGGAVELKALRYEVGRLMSPTDGNGEITTNERAALIVKAWNLFIEGEEITAKKIALNFHVEDEKRTLLDKPVMGGIDLGELDETAQPEVEEVVADEEIKDKAAKVKADTLAKKGAKPDPRDTSANELKKQLAAIRADHPKYIVMFETKDSYNLWEDDADAAVQYLGQKAGARDGMKYVTFKKSNYQPAVTAFNEAGLHVVVVTTDEAGNIKATRIKDIAKPKKAAK